MAPRRPQSNSTPLSPATTPRLVAGAAIPDLRWHVELLASDSDQALHAVSRAHAAWQVDVGSLPAAGLPRPQLRLAVDEFQPLGAVRMMPDNGVDPVSLVYSEPATSTAVTPTTWSEYSVFDRVVTEIEDEAGQRVIVVTPETAIEAVIPVVPAGACDATFVGDELNRWSRESRLTASELDRLLVATAQSDGSLRRTLIIINPSGGATCSALKTACSRCMSCGLEFVCKVVQELRSWIC